MAGIRYSVRMTITTTTEKELPQLLAIYNYEVENGLATFDIDTKDLNYWHQWYESHRQKNYCSYTAWEGEVAVGFGTLSKYRERSAYDGTLELSVYVHPEYRGRGIGKEMMKKLIDHANNDPSILTLVSVITSANETSIRLHQKLGFTYAGSITNVGVKNGKVLGIQNWQLMTGNPAEFGTVVAETPVVAPKDPATVWKSLIAECTSLVEGEDDVITNMANVSSAIFNSLEGLNWAGFYIVKDDHLQLGPFMGKPACMRIPFGRGVCGTAWKENATQLVYDVHQFPGHIACDSASNSEVVVPLHDAEGKVCGVLDIDSPLVGRFTEADRQGFEKLAALFRAGCVGTTA